MTLTVTRDKKGRFARFEQRTHPDAPEQRTVDVDVEGLEVRGKTVHGYAAVYGVESGDLGGFRERIAQGAFDEVLGGDEDVRCLLNHDPNIVLGRTKSGTLRLSSDQRGLRFECDMPESRSDLREAVARGDIDGASFRFKVGDEDWNGDLRTVKKIEELRDVTLATYPAYPSASIEMRTRPERKDNPPTPANGGGLVIRDRLRVEDRTQRTDDGADVERRVVEAIRGVRKGETRSLSLASADAITPPELSSYLFEKLRASSVALQSGIVVIPTDRKEITWPKLSADVSPGWYGDGDEIAPGDPTLVALEAVPKKLAHIVQVNNEVIDDSEPSVVDVLNNHLAVMLGLKLDLAIFEGDPEGEGDEDEINGMLHVEGIQHAKEPASYDPFIEAVGKLQAEDAPGPYVAVGPPSVFTALALLKDKNENQLAPPREMPKVLTSTQVSETFVYSPSQVVLVRRQDAEIELDRSRLFNKDQSEVRGKARADLLLPNPEAVVVLDEE
jgi:HK97 family phage prohead protease/HK97 family phage major capsid protein